MSFHENIRNLTIGESREPVSAATIYFSNTQQEIISQTD